MKLNQIKTIALFIGLFSMNLPLTVKACDAFLEDSGAITTVCPNGDGTDTFTVNSGYTDTPGSCQGAASGCEYSYVA